jgi:hypothetical protein
MSTTRESSATYWLTPVSSNENMRGQDIIRALVGQEMIYAFSQKVVSVRRVLEAGDWICFYASMTGIVAHARALGKPEVYDPPKIGYEHYPWVVRLGNPRLYIDNPVAINTTVRQRLDAFQGRDVGQRWSWFVQKTRRISEHDFKILTR